MSEVSAEGPTEAPPGDILPVAAQPPARRCLDCGSLVTGRYCAECGQSTETHVLTMHDVTHDVVHSALHLDSRVWQTLRSLLFRPGELTNAFIEGRRQRYLPPFRLYLVISVLFFALSAVLPGAELVHMNADGDTVIAYGKAQGDQARVPEGSRIDLDLPGLNDRLEAVNAKLAADGGAALTRAFLGTAPKLMFLFLPLMAAVVMLFYWRPRRLYAEHLVLFLHTHAFAFLVLTGTALLDALASLAKPLVPATGLLSLLLVLYVPVYVFRSMRAVYGDSAWRTALKFTAVSFIYIALLVLTLLLGLLYSALSL